MSPEPQIITDNNWFNNFSKPFIISGPCSAESEDQLLQTAHELKKSSSGAGFQGRDLEATYTSGRI